MLRRRKSRKFRSLGDVLPRVLKRLHLEKVVEAQKLVRLWPEVVGDKIAQHTRALSVEGKTLVVVVDSPGWMTQLTYLKPQLLKKVARQVKRGLVKDIRFVLGSGPTLNST